MGEDGTTRKGVVGAAKQLGVDFGTLAMAATRRNAPKQALLDTYPDPMPRDEASSKIRILSQRQKARSRPQKRMLLLL
jgi:hypothetical protein